MCLLQAPQNFCEMPPSQNNCEILLYPRFIHRSTILTGELSKVAIPDHLPLPTEVLNFVYGNNIEPPLQEQLMILTRLQELKGWNVEYCKCGHMLQRLKIISNQDEV